MAAPAATLYMSSGTKDRLISFLRWSEKYTKTDMVYLASSGFWINLNFVFTSVFAFLLSIAFANLLTKTTFGTYQYILSVSSILTAFTFTGFNTAITQSVARGYEGTLRASIQPQLLWNLVPASAALAWSGYYFLLGQAMLGIGILFVFLSLPLVNTFNSYNAYLNGKQEFKKNSLYMIAGGGAYYLLIFLGVWLFPAALPLIFINLFTTTIAAAYLYFRVIKTEQPNREVDSEALPFARHLSIMNALANAAMQIDSILVFHFLGAADLALYSIANLLPQKLGGAFKSLVQSALPRFSGRSSEEVRGNIAYRLFLFLIAILAVAGLYAFIAPELFRLIYPKYESAIHYSQVLALTLVSYPGSLATTVLYAHRKIRRLYVLNIFVPVTQVLLQVGGILLFGLWGLVGAKVLSSTVLSLTAILLLFVHAEKQSVT